MQVEPNAVPTSSQIKTRLRCKQTLRVTLVVLFDLQADIGIMAVQAVGTRSAPRHNAGEAPAQACPP